MESSIKTKAYWVKILPVLVWHALYLIFCGSFSKYTRVYFDLAFYLGILLYFSMWKTWNFSLWRKALGSGKRFWQAASLTALGMALMFCVGMGITMIFPKADSGLGSFYVTNWPSLIAFALVTVFLPPIAEELFYRKAIPAYDNKLILIATTSISVFLYASEHSLVPLGFLQACLWAIPLSIAYLKTKNVYVCMTAHFICNFAFNGFTVLSYITKLLGA